MSEIQFDEPQMQFRSRPNMTINQPKTPWIIEFLIKKQIARDEKHASKIILLSCGVILAVSLMLFIGYLSPSEANVYYSEYEEY